jgi:uncharacterized caspase-like protein
MQFATITDCAHATPRSRKEIWSRATGSGCWAVLLRRTRPAGAENYLVPVNANPDREADLDFELEEVGLVLKQMEGSGTRLNIVFLDACRNNPFGGRGLRTVENGLAQMRAPEGTVISFATQPGNVAQDGSDGHSPFTRALARTIHKPGLGIFDALNDVGLAVKSATGGSQQPWFSTSPISGAFYFAQPTGVSAPRPPTSTPAALITAPPISAIPPNGLPCPNRSQLRSRRRT